MSDLASGAEGLPRPRSQWSRSPDSSGIPPVTTSSQEFSMFRRSLSVVLATASVMTLQALASAPANAGAYGCTGSLVRSWPLPLKDAITRKTYYRSDVKLYYNARTGWNCAVLAKRPGLPRYGVRTPMSIYMENDLMGDDNVKNVKNKRDYDGGNFKVYAGPVKVYGRNLCVTIKAEHDDAENHGSEPTKYQGRLWLLRVGCR
ncbi:hypothetical protein [Nonomuraea sp. NPDC049028]|uniref:hypothetical protein n=1 Tax=Nonomuraea sp. NPDC049028 TaxID=3364348 RepID=UPI0037178A0F